MNRIIRYNINYIIIFFVVRTDNAIMCVVIAAKCFDVLNVKRQKCLCHVNLIHQHLSQIILGMCL